MNYSYGHEQFIKAVSTLVRGKGRIRERLADAYKESLRLVGVAPYGADLPAEFMPRWQEIKTKLTSIKANNDEDDLEGVLVQMSEDEASLIAAVIQNLETEFDSWLDANRPG